MLTVDLRVPGPASHGVARHARRLAEVLGEHAVTGPGDVTHTQFTDALWGPDVRSAAQAFQLWATTARRPLVVTLHDVPGADADPARDRRRFTAYVAVVLAADAVVVSSHHEAARLRSQPQLGLPAALVIPLPLPLMPPGQAAPTRAVGVLGFVYPGKGHDRAVTAAAAHGLDVVALGAVADGHGSLAAELAAQAAALGTAFRVSGHLTDAALAAAARSVAVPVSLHRTISASGSLLAWLAAGRRPVAVHDGFSEEVAARHPGSLVLVDDAGTADAVGRALADPASTRASVPAWPDVAALHLELYGSLL